MWILDLESVYTIKYFFERERYDATEGQGLEIW